MNVEIYDVRSSWGIVVKILYCEARTIKIETKARLNFFCWGTPKLLKKMVIVNAIYLSVSAGNW